MKTYHYRISRQWKETVITVIYRDATTNTPTDVKVVFRGKDEATLREMIRQIDLLRALGYIHDTEVKK